MWETILKALLAQVETHPDQVFSLLVKLVDLLQQHPEAMTALLKLLPKGE